MSLSQLDSQSPQPTWLRERASVGVSDSGLLRSTLCMCSCGKQQHHCAWSDCGGRGVLHLVFGLREEAQDARVVVDGLVEAVVVGLHHIVNQIFHALPLCSQLQADNTVWLFGQSRAAGGPRALSWSFAICRLLGDRSVDTQ